MYTVTHLQFSRKQQIVPPYLQYVLNAFTLLEYQHFSPKNKIKPENYGLQITNIFSFLICTGQDFKSIITRTFQKTEGFSKTDTKYAYSITENTKATQ